MYKQSTHSLPVLVAMDFDALFTGPAVLAKQLEMRWASSSSSLTPAPASHVVKTNPSNANGDLLVHVASVGNGGETSGAADPDTAGLAVRSNTAPNTCATGTCRIQHQCGAGVAIGTMGRPYLRRNLLYCRNPFDKSHFPLWKNAERSAGVVQELPKLDMLANLFGHTEPESYNEVLEETIRLGGKMKGSRFDSDGDTCAAEENKDGASRAVRGSSAAGATQAQMSVLRTPPPPRKRKRRITPTTTPASRPRTRKSAQRSVPSTPDSDAMSSSSPCVSSRQHTKLFFDVQMAQSPTKVLSPSTAEMKYGKAFPPYEPQDGGTGKWSKPQDPRTAFELFVESTRGQARLYLKRRDRNNKDKIDEQLEKLWANSSTTTVLYWKQEEEWDKQRYLHEHGLYTRARQLANCSKAGERSNDRSCDSRGGAVGVGSRPSPATSAPTSVGPSIFERRATVVPRRVSSVSYHFFYQQKDLPVAQIERRNDSRCPLCFQNCITDVGCVMHCQIVHGGDFLFFQGMKDEEGILHIGIHSKAPNLMKTPWPGTAGEALDPLDCVRIMNHQSGWDPADALRQKPLTNTRVRQDFVYSRRGSCGPSLTEVPILTRPFTAAASLDAQDRKRKTQLLRGLGADEDAVRRIVPDALIPARQYYHSKTNLPMQQDEWKYDSDDESDDSWIEKKSNQLIDEFDDVSEKEKYFLKLWNHFMSGAHKLVADRGILSRCVEFIKLHGTDIAERGMRQLLFLHFCNLWDEEILSSDHISALMALFDRQCAVAIYAGKGKSRATRFLPRAAKSPNHRRKISIKPGNSSLLSPGRSRMTASRKKAKRGIAF